MDKKYTLTYLPQFEHDLAAIRDYITALSGTTMYTKKLWTQLFISSKAAYHFHWRYL